jgi:hypothetical protein
LFEDVGAGYLKSLRRDDAGLDRLPIDDGCHTGRAYRRLG